jgi:hypothetical protein
VYRFLKVFTRKLGIYLILKNIKDSATFRNIFRKRQIKSMRRFYSQFISQGDLGTVNKLTLQVILIYAINLEIYVIQIH